LINIKNYYQHNYNFVKIAVYAIVPYKVYF
jgi:hypothetical protein